MTITTTNVISTTPVVLDYDGTIALSGDLTREFIGTWSLGTDTFGLFMGVAMFVLVLGVFQVLVAWMRVRR